MSIVLLRLPKVKYCQENCPQKCPYCGGEIFQRWGGAVKRLTDPRLKEAWVYRYRCCRCRRTFRHDPEGVERARQTVRMRALAVIGWVFGMSYQKLSLFLTAFRVVLSAMSLWRDVQQRAEELRRELLHRGVLVLGVDGAYMQGWGKTQPVLVAVDIGRGEPLTVRYVNEKDPQAVRKFLEPLMQEFGVSVIVTKDLASYQQAAEDLGLEHQVCQFHVRRWVGRTVHDLKQSLPPEWVETALQVRQLLQDLPIDGDKRLLTMLRRLPPSPLGRKGSTYTPLDQLRTLMLRLSENWSRFRVFD